MAFASQSPTYQFPSPVQPNLYGYPTIQPESTPVQPPAEPLSAPDASFVTPRVASQAVKQLVSAQLRVAGFEAAEPAALRRLEDEVIACEFVMNRQRV
jgi:transcription initiation factor TFIID subunit 8